MVVPRRYVLCLLVALIGGAASRASAQPLPAEVVPDQYELRFAFDLQHDSFTGSAQILVNIVKPTTRIMLNAAGLSFRQVTIVSDSGSQPATVAVDERRETATFTVQHRLAAGPARVRIEYTGRLDTAPRGLFVGRAGGRKFAASQFEATDARRAYPCFDQPDMKASFLVTATAPAGDMVISNGRVLSDTPGPGANEHTVRFATTRRISTYLVAIAVGEFDCLEAEADAVPIRVCTLAGGKPFARFALDAAQSFLRYYDGYFAVKYPFGKLDLLAIPDFPGGMENAGAIFFGERELLVDPQQATIESQKRVATVIAHEMAHQWVGDLVTMTWWDDLWLKEGFATLFETRPVRAWKPEWHIELDEVTSAEEAMSYDGVDGSRAARTTVTTRAEIDAAYDAAVYQKAGAVLRMIEATMGADEFRAGLNTFVKRFSYANATAEDFWSTMAEKSVRGVDQILRTFLDQPGVPVVSLTARCVTSATSSLALAQQRFWTDPKQATTSTSVWAIPVSTRPVAPQPGTPALSIGRLLAAKEQTFDLAGCNALIIGNAEANGYFRTSYAPEVLVRLAKDAGTQLTPVERLRLLDDQWAIARSGAIGIGEYLSLVSGYSADQTPQIIERVGETLRAIDDQLVTDADREAFRAWMRRLLAPPASDQESGIRNRESGGHAGLLHILGTVAGDVDVRTRARAVLVGQAGDAPTDPELMDAYTRVAAAGGDAQVFDRITANIEQATSPQIRDRNVRALGDFTDPALVRRALDYALSEHVPATDVGTVIAAALDNRAARPTAWAFVKSRWKEIAARGDADQSGGAILASAASFCDPGLRDDVKAFFGEKDLGGSRDLRQTLEQIQACIDFRAAQQENFRRWLATTR